MAVALGVGVALASGQAVAWAEDGGSADSDASAASSPAAGTAPRTNPPSAPASPSSEGDDTTATTGESDDADSEAAVAAAPDPSDPEPVDGSERHSSQRPSTKPDRAAREVTDATAEVDSDDTQPDAGSGRHSREPNPTYRRQQIDERPDAGRHEVPEPAESRLTDAVQSTPRAGAVAARPVTADAGAVQQISTPPDEEPTPETTVGKAVVTVLAAAALGPLTSDDPAAPVDSPVELALLAVGTRLRTSGDPTDGEPVGSPAVATLSVESSSEAMTFGMAALTAPNSAPTVPPQPIGVPNPVTGVVVGTVIATDTDGNALTYAVVTGPAKGTVELNPATGANTYTPTQLARLDAGTTAGPDTDSFTVAVSDGQQTTNAAVSVYVSPLQYATSASLTTGPAPSAVAVTADGRMFVANTANWTVSVIDTATGKQIDAQPNNWFSNDIQVGPWPGALLLSPDGKKLYIANTGWLTVSVIDTTTYKAIDADPANWFSNDISVGSNPSAMTLGADGRLYVANRGGASVSVIDTNTFKRIDTDPNNWFNNDISVGNSPSALTLGGTALYVANRDSNTVSVIDTSTYRITKTLAVGKQPAAMALGSNGSLYVVNTGSNTVSVIDTATNTVGASSISVGPAPTSIAFDPATRRAFVANGNDTVSVIDTTNNMVLSTGVIGTDKTGGHALTVGPNGIVYIADTNNNTVQALTLGRGNTAPIVATPVVSAPDPDDGRVSMKVTVNDPDGDALAWSWALSDPSTGSFGSDSWIGDTRSFYFFPSQAARDAAASGGPTTTKITITVTDDRTTIPVNVTVPILPTPGPTRVTVVGAVGLPGSVLQPRRAMLSPDGTRAVVITDSAYGVLTGATAQVAVINTDTGKQIGTTVTLAGRSAYDEPTFSADGTRVVITTNVTDTSGAVTAKVSSINLNTGAVVAGAVALAAVSSATQGAPSTLSLVTSTDGGVVRATVIDTATGQQVGTTLALSGDGSVLVSRDGSRAVLQAVQTDAQTGTQTTQFASLNTSTGTQIGTTMVRSGAWSIPTYMDLLTDDGSRAVIITGLNPTIYTTATQVAVIDTAGTQIGSTLTVAGTEFGSIRAATDGSRALMVTNVYDGRLSINTTVLTVIDTTTGAQVGGTTMLTGFIDGGVRFDPGTRRAVITTMSSNFTTTGVGTTQVAIINTTTGQQLGTTLTLADNVYSGSTVSADGSLVVVKTGTKLALLSTASGYQLGNTITRAAIGAVAVSRDGHHVVYLTGPASYFGWEPIQAEILKIG